jgi:hypothetical protein
VKVFLGKGPGIVAKAESAGTLENCEAAENAGGDWLIDSAARVVRMSVGRGSLRPAPDRLVDALIKLMNLALVRPVGGHYTEPMTNGIVPDVLPLRLVAFRRAQLRVPEVALPKRPVIGFECACRAVLPISDPTLERDVLVRRAEQMDVIGKDYVAANKP